MDKAQVDEQGYRLGVGMIILNAKNRVFWACRSDREDAWQFPQGGIHTHECPMNALYRELFEEVGLTQSQVQVVAESKEWLFYELPFEKQCIENQRVVGQRQKWFLLRMLVDDDQIDLHATAVSEFCAWQWVEYWYPLSKVVFFKQNVYKKALTEFADYRVG